MSEVQETKLSVNFAEDYYKLDNNEFTTIRGISWYDRIEVVDIISIKLRREHQFYAKITHKQKIKIENISLCTLQEDAEYPGYKIESRQDFIDLINSFCPRSTMQSRSVDEKSVMTLIQLERVDVCENCIEEKCSDDCICKTSSFLGDWCDRCEHHSEAYAEGLIADYYDPGPDLDYYGVDF